MRHSTSRPIRLAIALAAASTLALTACGDDDGGEGGGGGASADSFCDEIAVLGETSDDATDEQILESLRSVADVTPDEISDEMGQLVDAFEQLQSFDPETASEEEMSSFVEMAGELDAASASIEDFAVENCPDLPADIFGTD